MKDNVVELTSKLSGVPPFEVKALLRCYAEAVAQTVVSEGSAELEGLASVLLAAKSPRSSKLPVRIKCHPGLVRRVVELMRIVEDAKPPYL